MAVKVGIRHATNNPATVAVAAYSAAQDCTRLLPVHAYAGTCAYPTFADCTDTGAIAVCGFFHFPELCCEAVRYFADVGAPFQGYQYADGKTDFFHLILLNP